MAEKLKEKFTETINDELVGLNIYSSQVKFANYREKYEILLDDDGPYEFNEQISSELGQTLMKFNTDEYKNDRLQLIEKLVKKIRSTQINMDGELFHSIVFVYTESQQWQDVGNVLRELIATANCQPQQKTVKYLRQNLMYCFQDSIRLDVLDAIDLFDQKFFSYTARKQMMIQDRNRNAGGDDITIDDLKMGQMDKKAARREARMGDKRRGKLN